MKLKIIGTRDRDPFEISADDIDDYINNHCYCGEIRLREYIFDEAGNMCGLKGYVDLGSGYGIKTGWEEFTIKLGETYSFIHSRSCIDGPTDWSTDDIGVVFQLVESEE